MYRNVWYECVYMIRIHMYVGMYVYIWSCMHLYVIEWNSCVYMHVQCVYMVCIHKSVCVYRHACCICVVYMNVCI